MDSGFNDNKLLVLLFQYLFVSVYSWLLYYCIMELNVKTFGLYIVQ